MTEARILDRATITGARITASGYLTADVRCARTGCQTYTRKELGLTGDGAITVYRPETAVFDKASMATYAGKPITVGHPKEPVTAENWKTHAVGDVGEEIARDGEFVRVSIKLMDAAAIKAVERGTREISMGYTTPIEMQDGIAPDGTSYQAVQTGPIKINHLALVDVARGGTSLRIGDGAVQWGAAPITSEDEEKATMTLRNIVVDGLSVETTDAGAQAINKLQGTINAMQTDHATVLTAKDGEIAKLKKDLEEKDGALTAAKKKLSDATSPQAMADASRKWAKITAAGKKAGLSDASMETMADGEIMRAVVAKSLGDEAAKGMSDESIVGAFQVCADATPTTPKDAALGDGIQNTNDAASFWDSIGAKKKGA